MWDLLTYCMILYSIMCWDILRYAFICVKKKSKKSATCLKEEYVVLVDSWTVGKQISELPFPDENHSLGVYFLKGRRGFYFSEPSKYYIICTGKRQNYFSSAHNTWFVYVIDINLVF